MKIQSNQSLLEHFKIAVPIKWEEKKYTLNLFGRFEIFLQRLGQNSRFPEVNSI